MESYEVANNIKALLILDGYDSYLTKDSLKIKYTNSDVEKYFIVPFDFLNVMSESITEEEMGGDTKSVYIKKIILHAYQKWVEGENQRLFDLEVIKAGRKQELEEKLKSITNSKEHSVE